MKDTVLVVDDVEINRLILREILCDDYEVLEASDGIEAIEVLFSATQDIHAVLLDIMMPGMDGFEVLSIIKANPGTDKIPVLFITSADANTNESRGLMAGAADYISKPFNPDVVKARVDNHIQLLRYNLNLELLVEKKTADLTRIYEQTLETLATIIEYRSLESGTHIRRSSELMRILISQMLPLEHFRDSLIRLQFNSIIKAVALHDIGKVGIPDSILLKPGSLTAEEFEVIKQHTTIGANIVQKISHDLEDDALYLLHCEQICRSHHERWDGRGYPDALKGDEIPLAARMLSIVDVYDALVNPRCYKAAYPHEEAVSMIKAGAGTQFDPAIVEVFLQVSEQFREIEEMLGDSTENAIP